VKQVKFVLGAIVSILILAWMIYDFLVPFFYDIPQPDCYYTDRGCEGQSRFGQ
jgi:hypothetical protein